MRDWAGVFKELQNHGRMVNGLDILVASIVLRNRETLVSRDDGFKRIRGLNLQEW